MAQLAGLAMMSWYEMVMLYRALLTKLTAGMMENTPGTVPTAVSRNLSNAVCVPGDSNSELNLITRGAFVSTPFRQVITAFTDPGSAGPGTVNEMLRYRATIAWLVGAINVGFLLISAVARSLQKRS